MSYFENMGMMPELSKTAWMVSEMRNDTLFLKEDIKSFNMVNYSRNMQNEM